MFNTRERIELLVMAILLVFGTPIAAYFGHQAGVERSQELWPAKKPQVIQDLLQNEQAAQDSAKAAPAPSVVPDSAK
jgi:hypothetical protein